MTQFASSQLSTNPIWLTDSKFALVTQEDGVFHFDINYSVHPELVIPYQNLAAPQEYEVDPSMRFHVLKTRAKGLFNMELFDSYTSERFVCEGSACCFAQVRMDEDVTAQPSRMLFCYTEKQQDGRNHRLHTIQDNKHFMNLFANYTLYLMEIGDVPIDNHLKY